MPGCGSQTYEQRLAATAEYFEYRHMLDQHLNVKPWRNFGVEVRASLPFSLLPPPMPEYDDDGNVLNVPPDTRQPGFIRGGIPHLLAAWQAALSVDGNDRPAYIFLASNFVLHQQGEKEQAATFHRDFLHHIGSNVSSDQWPAELEVMIKEVIPSGPSFAAKKELRTATGDLKVNRQDYTATLYLAENGVMQVAVLYVIPQGVAETAEVARRRALSLETLIVSEKPPPSPQDEAAAPAVDLKGRDPQ